MMKVQIQKIAFVACLAAGLALPVLIVGHDPHGKNQWTAPEADRRRPNPVLQTPAGMAAARVLYIDKCEQCHGEKGQGDGPMAEMHDAKPANFTDAKMMKAMTDGELFWKMSEGREPMPSFRRQLSEEERWNLVHFLRTFARPADSTKKSEKPAPPKKNSAAKNQSH